MTDETDDLLNMKALEPMKDAPIAMGPGIASVALSMAMKYHDINMVKDGALYQQYKIEGRNMTGLNLDMVFETAIRIERHLLASSDRIAAMVIDALAPVVSGDEGSDEAEEAPAHD
jgi:hypothetical protein